MLRKVTYASLIIIIIGVTVWGLTTHNSLLQTQSDSNLLGRKIADLEISLGETEHQLVRAEEDLASANLTINTLESELELYEDMWGSVYTRDLHPEKYSGVWQYLVNNETADDPTWAQLLDFLREDKTDENAYVKGRYDCHGFARDVHNNAERAGIRAALVNAASASVKHDFNAFKTTDRGLVFIDCSGTTEPQPGQSYDKIVDIKLGGDYSFRLLFPELSEYIVATKIGTIHSLRIVW